MAAPVKITSLGTTSEYEGDPPESISLRPERKLFIGGDITDGDSNPIPPFSLTERSALLNGRKAWSIDGTEPFEGDKSVCEYSGGLWSIFDFDSKAIWTSTANVATPDLVPRGAYHETLNPDAWQTSLAPESASLGVPICTLGIPYPVKTTP